MANGSKKSLGRRPRVLALNIHTRGNLRPARKKVYGLVREATRNTFVLAEATVEADLLAAGLPFKNSFSSVGPRYDGSITTASIADQTQCSDWLLPRLLQARTNFPPSRGHARGGGEIRSQACLVKGPPLDQAAAILGYANFSIHRSRSMGKQPYRDGIFARRSPGGDGETFESIPRHLSVARTDNEIIHRLFSFHLAQTGCRLPGAARALSPSFTVARFPIEARALAIIIPSSRRRTALRA